jgi:hypothetical protein
MIERKTELGIAPKKNEYIIDNNTLKLGDSKYPSIV